MYFKKIYGMPPVFDVFFILVSLLLIPPVYKKSKSIDLTKKKIKNQIKNFI
jgi:hypothetical protein